MHCIVQIFQLLGNKRNKIFLRLTKIYVPSTKGTELYDVKRSVAFDDEGPVQRRFNYSQTLSTRLLKLITNLLYRVHSSMILLCRVSECCVFYERQSLCQFSRFLSNKQELQKLPVALDYTNKIVIDESFLSLRQSLRVNFI